MKNTMKKLLSLLLVLTMTVGIAPLSGFVGLELPEITLSDLGDFFSIEPKAAETFTEGIYTYTVENGEATITKCDSSASGEVIVPEILGGYPVTSIGSSAFYNCTNLASVTIGDSVTIIGDFAFYNCISLTSVTIGDSVTSIGYYAFFGCTSLTSITIPDNVKKINEGAFEKCTSLFSITIPDNVELIGLNAFYNSGLYNDKTNWDDGILYISNHLIKADIKNAPVEYKVKNNTITIASSAFSFCENIERIELPEGLRKIGNRAFYQCQKLSQINIPDSVDNIGYEILAYTQVELFSWSNADSYIDKHLLFGLEKVLYGDHIVKYGTLTIAGRAFKNCNGLYGIDIPETVVAIGVGAFQGCSELTEISIPNSIKSIRKSTFDGCEKLSDVYYNGTEEEWNKITIEKYNVSLLNATIHFLKSSCEHEYTSVTTKEATCLSAGEKTYTCSLCGRSYVEVIPALSHITAEAVTENNKGATCTENGSFDTVVYCTVCNTEISRVTTVVDAIGHDYDDGVITKEPTCSAEGEKTFTCSVCGDAYTEKIDKKDHVAKEMGFDATCTVNGISYSVCANCGITLGSTTIIPATGHVAGSWVQTKAPQCAVDGEEELRCTKCNELLDSRVISSPGHAYDAGVVTKEPTCTEEGVKTFTCDCGDSYTEKIPATGHTAGEWIQTKAPQCAIDGEEELRCTKCNELLNSRAVPSPGHVYNSGVVTKEPTCTEEGVKTFTCTCGDSYTETIPAKGHDYTSIVTAPTCTEKGYTTYTCICGHGYISDYTDMIPHTPGEWESVLEPTVEAEGKKIRKCSVCGITVEEEAIEKLLVVTDEKTGVGFEYSGEKYDGEVGIIVEETFDGAAFNLIDTDLDPSQNRVFDIKITVDGVESQPNGEIIVRIPIPEGYNPEKTFVYHIDTVTGVVEKMPAEVVDGCLVFKTTHFSYYAVVELAKKVSGVSIDNIAVSYKAMVALEEFIRIDVDKSLDYEITYFSSDLSVAAVDKNGYLIATGTGEAEITVTVTDENGNIVEDKCTVTVSYTWWQWLIVIFLFGWIWY